MSEFFIDDGLSGVFGLTPTMVLESLTIETVERIIISLGATGIVAQEEKLILPTICHNPAGVEKSHKLYYYGDSKLFTCYTECGQSFNIYELVRKVFAVNGENIGFYEAFNYVLQFVSREQFTVESPYKSISTQYARRLGAVALPEYDMNVLSAFRPYPTAEWLNDGIDVKSMEKYQIGFSVNQTKIVIPHFDIGGRLIGIRGRALDPVEVESYGKYMPIRVEGKWYTHHLSLNLYGANITKDAIMKTKRVVVFEGEKSVLLMDTFFGEDNLAVAVCGSNLHKVQVDILVKQLGVTDITIAFDKEYPELGTPESEQYKYKLIDLCKKYSDYANMSFIYDMKGYLKEKDSPVDRGKEIFERLYEERVKVR